VGNVRGGDLPNLIASAASREGIFYQRHLARLETTLNNQPDLSAAMANVLRARTEAVLSPRIKGQLEGLGLVKVQGESITPRCDLYRKYFGNLLLI
jgi:hypothetical protein